MKWEEFLNLVAKLPVIETELLLAGVPDQRSLKVQISRWQKAGNLIQIRRGIYVLAEPYRRLEVYEFYLAAVLKKPSYISLEKALEHHGLIPDAVSVYTSVTTKRPGKIISDMGVFDYRHIKSSLFFGYNSSTVNRQTAFIASAEKALLDLCYLKGVDISEKYLKGLRLQNVGKIKTDRLFACAKRFKKPGILKNARVIADYIDSYEDEEKTL